MTGIGLLDAETVFETRKQRTRVTGTVQRLEGIFAPLNGVSVEGYEIHMGRTVSSSLEPAISLAREEGDVHGDGLTDGNVFGSYVHGIFDSDELLSGLTRILIRMKGLEEEAAVFRRGRNAHVKSVPGHATRAQYGEATALEALLGWLYLQGRRERINQLFRVMMEE